MSNDIKLFEGNQIRSSWNSEKEEWYFSIIDILGVLTESENPRKYWSVLKTRLKKEGKITAPRKTWGFSHAGIALIPRNVYNT